MNHQSNWMPDYCSYDGFEPPGEAHSGYAKPSPALDQYKSPAVTRQHLSTPGFRNPSPDSDCLDSPTQISQRNEQFYPVIPKELVPVQFSQDHQVGVPLTPHKGEESYRNSCIIAPPHVSARPGFGKYHSLISSNLNNFEEQPSDFYPSYAWDWSDAPAILDVGQFDGNPGCSTTSLPSQQDSGIGRHNTQSSHFSPVSLIPSISPGETEPFRPSYHTSIESQYGRSLQTLRSSSEFVTTPNRSSSPTLSFSDYQQSFRSQHSTEKSNIRLLPKIPHGSLQHIPSSAGVYSTLKSDPLITLTHLPFPPIRHPELSFPAIRHPTVNTFAHLRMIKIKIILHKTTFVAGGEIFGRMDLVVKSSKSFGSKKLGSFTVGEIGIELLGYEEVQSRPSHPSRAFVFLQSRHIFQLPSQTLPYIRCRNFESITSAVSFPHPPPDSEGYRKAKEGLHSFPFTFNLPKDSPSSTEVEVARIKYVITGYTKVRMLGTTEIIEKSESVDVVGTWDLRNAEYQQPLRMTTTEHGVFVSAKIEQPLIPSGEDVVVDIRIENNSSKKISRVRLQLINNVTLYGDRRGKAEIPGEASTTPDNQVFELVIGAQTDKEHVIAGKSGLGMKWTMRLSTKDVLRTIKNAALFKVCQYIRITIPRGRFSKPLDCTMPAVSIVHSGSLTANPPTSEISTWEDVSTLCSEHLVQGSRVIETQERLLIDVIQPDFYVDVFQRTHLYNEE